MLSNSLDVSLARKDCGLLFDGRLRQTLQVKAKFELIGDYEDMEKVRDVVKELSKRTYKSENVRPLISFQHPKVLRLLDRSVV
jgi:hypothetical protein